jgi:hypothetical protein
LTPQQQALIDWEEAAPSDDGMDYDEWEQKRTERAVLLVRMMQEAHEEAG